MEISTGSLRRGCKFESIFVEVIVDSNLTTSIIKSQYSTGSKEGRLVQSPKYNGFTNGEKNENTTGLGRLTNHNQWLPVRVSRNLMGHVSYHGTRATGSRLVAMNHRP